MPCIFKDAKEELREDAEGGGGRRGFSARGGGAERRFATSNCEARASRSTVRPETNALTFLRNVPPSSANSL